MTMDSDRYEETPFRDLREHTGDQTRLANDRVILQQHPPMNDEQRGGVNTAGAIDRQSWVTEHWNTRMVTWEPMWFMLDGCCPQRQ